MSTETAQDMSDEVIPIPYVAGASLRLEITQNYQDLPLPRVTTASITRVLDITMSSVMCVTITLDSGQDVQAVLKLYDRRFGVDLRDYRMVHLPLTTKREALFESFVRRNAIGPFLTQLAKDQEGRLLPIKPHHHLDDENVEGNEKYEAALWKDCDDMFHCETKAYELLKDLQGAGVPRLLATVRLGDTSSIIPSDLIDGPDAKYWDVNGILLQYIPGINLINLDSSSIDVKEWPILVQRSVDLVHKINEYGVVMMDCSTRNVIVDQESHQPFVIDFAQCWFKDEMKLWEPSNEQDDEDDEEEESEEKVAKNEEDEEKETEERENERKANEEKESEEKETKEKEDEEKEGEEKEDEEKKDEEKKDEEKKDEEKKDEEKKDEEKKDEEKKDEGKKDEEKKDEEKEDEDSEIDLEDEYWYRVRSTDNPGAIGYVMRTRLQREKGVKIKVQFPDIYERPLE
ncbi:hypothetical protein H0G86_010973 [Trichoderma simmonsii]|uniref:Protein kinase domain-containing protein n=1 Tax=Trichoderma simmonsii TaxID=1491479 RepID=A0A8G0LNI6_9HYPO|nr:hypothetical protein H0G86_010973 [Trichoderma simmonsii]